MIYKAISGSSFFTHYQCLFFLLQSEYIDYILSISNIIIKFPLVIAGVILCFVVEFSRNEIWSEPTVIKLEKILKNFAMQFSMRYKNVWKSWIFVNNHFQLSFNISYKNCQMYAGFFLKSCSNLHLSAFSDSNSFMTVAHDHITKFSNLNQLMWHQLQNTHAYRSLLLGTVMVAPSMLNARWTSSRRFRSITSSWCVSSSRPPSTPTSRWPKATAWRKP